MNKHDQEKYKIWLDAYVAKEVEFQREMLAREKGYARRNDRMNFVVVITTCAAVGINFLVDGLTIPALIFLALIIFTTWFHLRIMRRYESDQSTNEGDER